MRYTTIVVLVSSFFTMPSLIQNKYFRYGLFGVALLVGLFVLVGLWAAMNMMTATTGLSSQQEIVSFGMPSASNRMAYDGVSVQADMAYAPEYYPTPDLSGGYTALLERYETTDYDISARTTELDTVCALLTELKADDAINFRTLNQSLNYCRATFFVAEMGSTAIVEQFRTVPGVTITRTTESVTRHREQLLSRADVLRRQLASVSSTLATAEAQYTELIALAKDNNDSRGLANAIEDKFRLVDSLTARQLRLTEQLDALYQQSADLEERLGVVGFSVQFTRSYAIDPDRVTRKWEQAWEQLRETYTDTLIGLSAFFGIFLLWVIRLTLYGVVLLVLVRLLWKIARLVWRL